MSKKEWYTPSANGDGKIYNVMYTPDNMAPKAIMVIVHGMAGHSGQYTSFCEELNNEGYVASAIDLQGHGRSQNHPGYFGKDGWHYMQNDLRRHIKMVRDAFPDLPIFLFGHSMGSFMIRSYVVRFTDDVDALIISGTAGHNPAVYGVIAYIKLKMLIQGGDHVAMSIGRAMVKRYLRKVKDPVNVYAWCSTDEKCCIEHAEDPYRVFFTLNAYYELYNSASKLRPDRWAENVPKIPIYIFSGSEDPVGDYGKGPKEVNDWLVKTGHDTSLHIYEGYRHEMLWDKNCEEVKHTLYEWMEGKLPDMIKKHDERVKRTDSYLNLDDQDLKAVSESKVISN